MSIKQAMYNIKEDNGYNTYHFETNNGQVKVVDKDNNVLGTNKEFAQEGKVISSGKVTDLKVSGIYKIKNVTGLPSEVAIDKISILEITSVGETNNPEMILYKLTTDTGTIYSKTVNPGRTSTDWSLGGIKVQSSLNTLNSAVGNLGNLKTTAKSNLVDALNESYSKANNAELKLSTLNTDYTGHNHDDRYIKTLGGSLDGDLIVKLGSGFKVKNANGKIVNLLTQTDYQTYELGNSDSVLNLRSSNILLHNGKKVWTEYNDGHYSGLDADLLDGNHAGAFAKIESSNTFTQVQRFDKGISTRTTMDFDNGSLKLNDVGDFVIHNDKQNRDFTITNGGDLNGLSNVTFDVAQENVEGRVQWKLGDDVLGFLRNQTYNSGSELWFHHWGKGGGRVFTVNGSDNTVRFDRSIYISGRQLFMQDKQPSGTIPVGSIWIT